MKMKTKVKAGEMSVNHNETQTRDGLKPRIRKASAPPVLEATTRG